MQPHFMCTVQSAAVQSAPSVTPPAHAQHSQHQQPHFFFMHHHHHPHQQQQWSPNNSDGGGDGSGGDGHHSALITPTAPAAAAPSSTYCSSHTFAAACYADAATTASSHHQHHLQHQQPFHQHHQQHQQQQPLKVAHSPLKRRHTGVASFAPAAPRPGLSRSYAGKSQSFDCIADLGHNPWGGDTALALAKRRAVASPLAVSGSPSDIPLPVRKGWSLCDTPPLGWSIEEEDDDDDGCILMTRGGGPADARAASRLTACSSSSEGGSGGAAERTAAVCRGDTADDAGSVRCRSAGATAVAGGGCGGSIGSSGGALHFRGFSTAAAVQQTAAVPMVGVSSSAAAAAGGVSPTPSWPPPLAPRTLARHSWDVCSTSGGGGGGSGVQQQRARNAPLCFGNPFAPGTAAGGTCSGDDSGDGGRRAERGGAVADELCAALQGARLSASPPFLGGPGFWVATGGSTRMDSG